MDARNNNTLVLFGLDRGCVCNKKQICGPVNPAPFPGKRHPFDNGFIQRGTQRGCRPNLPRHNEDIGAEHAEFRGKAALGINLEIEKGSGDGCACAKGEQYNEKAAGIGAEQASDDAPEHGSITCAMSGHHSPRRMGAGSYREARRNGRALPRIVTPAASAITTKKTISEGSGAAPKIFSPTTRARTIPSA